MVAGDGDLLVLGVAVERDKLHAVKQRAGDRVEHVGRGQEDHVGQVQVHVQVVVAERVVLRRVQHLEQRGRRVAPVVRADLVDLVQQHDGVHRPRLADGPDDAAGQRADVGAPVAADLRLVPHAAERDPDELPVHGASDGLTERGLAHARRADQGEHGPGATAADDAKALVAPALADGQVLDDALLDVVQAGVVLIQHPARAGDVVGVLGPLVPRDVEDRVEPGADPAGLRRRVGGALQLVDFLEGRFADLLRQVGGLDAGPVVVFLGSGTTAGELVQLLADGGELLAQQELLLLLLHALGDVLADRLGDIQLG